MKADMLANRPRLIGIAAVLVLVLAMGLSTHYSSADEVEANGNSKKFDSAKFGADTYESKVVPAIEKDAVDVATLVPALKDDPEAAGEKYGKREGSSPYTYSVRAVGKSGKPESGLLPLTIDGLGDVTVSVQIGPAVNGTALRDATGLVSFNDFVNQVEFADAAIALNKEMSHDVLASLDVASLEGKTVTVIGATAPLNPKLLTITPVSIEVGP